MLVGPERIGGVAVCDVTDPGFPASAPYANTRQGSSGDREPEGLTIVPAVRSPNKEPLLLVGNEISGTTAILQISLH